jgi:lipoate-protein ligase A
MPPARLILEPISTTGAWNMAVDETLLESSLANGATTIRLYQWAAPTVSLGYFQDADEFKRDPQWQGLAAVRRLSGGGAILHDREITYSITLPRSHPLTAHPSQLYRLAHEAIIDALATHGITVHMRGNADHRPGAPARALRTAADTPSLALRAGEMTFSRSINHQPSTINLSSLDTRPSTPDHFLCFGRGDPNDIILGADKIAGSAQRRRRGAILQHGSVLIERSPHAPEFPGLRELTGVELIPGQLGDEIGAALGGALAGSIESAPLSPDEFVRARELERTRYSTLRWRPHAVSAMTNDN